MWSVCERVARRVGEKCLLKLTLATVATLTACSNPPPVELVGRKDVSVAKALQDIGRGFRSLSSELDGAVLGVVPCKISMVLVVKASATEDNTLAIGISEAPAEIVGKSVQIDADSKVDTLGFGVIGSREGQATANRDNTITIELYNPGCLPKDTLGYDKPSDVKSAMTGMLVTHRMAQRYPNLLGRAQQVVDDAVRRDKDTLNELRGVEEPNIPGE